MINLLKGKNIQLLKPVYELLPLTIKVETGELILSNGEPLKFGHDYLLIDADNENLLKIYSCDNILIHEMRFSDD